MANCSLWWLMRCSETEWVRARGSCETLRSESLQRRRLRALMFTSALKLHTHVSTLRLKDTVILLTLVRQPNLSPPTCYILSCLLRAQPSHIRTSSNATFSAKPFQMTLVSTNDSPHYLHPQNIKSPSIFCSCTPSISVWPFSLGLNQTVLDHNLLTARMLFYLFCIPSNCNVHSECLIHNKVKWKHKICLTL